MPSTTCRRWHRPAAPSSSSIAAGTCFISTRSRARRSAPMPRRFIVARGSKYLSSFRDAAKRRTRNPYSAALGLWIPGSLALLAPRNDSGAVELQHVETDVAVDDINQPAVVEHDVVALRRGTAADRIGNEIANFAWRHRIGDVD